jgi:hypothetical protein
MSLQPVLIFCLVLGILFFAVSLLIYRRKGMSAKGWYTLLGIFIVAALAFVLDMFLGAFDLWLAVLLVALGALSIFFAWRWKPGSRW